MEQWVQYMDLSDKAYASYIPYRKEAGYCLCIDIVIITFLVIFLLAMNIHQFAPHLFVFCLLFIIIEIFTNYRIALLSFLEIRSHKFVTTELYLVEIGEEFSLSGKWGSQMLKLYSPQMMVRRYRFIFKAHNGKRLVLRCAMSAKKAQKVKDVLAEKETISRRIIFGKYTHIILKCDDKDEIASVLNTKI